MAQPVRQGPPIMTPIIVGVVLALLVGSSSPWWWEKAFSSDDDQTEEGVEAGQESNGGSSTQTDTQSQTQTDDDLGTTPDTDTDGGGGESGESDTNVSCKITIENPLVTLYEDTDTFGLEAGRAAPGSYAVKAIETVTFAGNPRRWFQITADGVTGWVQDSSILIASKSGDCT